MARFWQKSLHDNVIISNDNTTDGQSPVGEPEKARLSQSLKAEQNHPLIPRPIVGKKKILGCRRQAQPTDDTPNHYFVKAQPERARLSGSLKAVKNHPSNPPPKGGK